MCITCSMAELFLLTCFFLILYCCCVFAQARDEVEVWLHADDSCMSSISHGRFMQHWVPGEDDPRVYAAEAVPDHVTSMVSGQQLHVGVVVARALKLRCETLHQ